MSYATITQYLAGIALQLRAIFNGPQRGRAAALALLLAAGVALGTGSVGVHAQPEPGAAEVATVNINAADAATLAARLKGVGHSRAQEIVRYRESYGRFTSAEELMEVKGIGRSTLDMNRQIITLE